MEHIRFQRLATYASVLERLFPEEFENGEGVFDVTFQVTDGCNLRCSYCYQIAKKTHMLSFEDAKKFVDMLLSGEENPYYKPEGVAGFVFNFIGGEPLINMELIEQITDYVISAMIQMRHPLLFRTRFSICCNGTLYFSDAFQKYLNKFRPWFSLSISIDGNKELHDRCRVFPDGSGSYDMAVAAAKHYKELISLFPSTKLTLSPANVEFLFPAVKNLLDIGYVEIIGNPAFEKGWELKHARIYYRQLMKLADYLFDNDLDDKVYISFFEEQKGGSFFQPYDFSKPHDLENWCGGNGRMIAINHTGRIYPCLRDMEDALGGEVPPIVIGDVEHGLGYTQEQLDLIDELQAINTKTQSSEECINCPIGKGCSWCQAYNYQDSGCLNHRATYICWMHKARCLANEYFWNRYYEKYGMSDHFVNYMKPEWIEALQSEDEE